MNLYDVTVTSFLKMLANVDKWLDKADDIPDALGEDIADA